MTGPGHSRERPGSFASRVFSGDGYAVEVVFGGLGLIPSPASAKIPDQGVSWDYTTCLNIIFLLLAAALIVRFVRTGGLAMLRMMGGAPDTHDH
jgi:uncharacterized protein